VRAWPDETLQIVKSLAESFSIGAARNSASLCFCEKVSSFDLSTLRFSVHTGGRRKPIARHGHSGQAYCTSLALAEWFCRTANRVDPAQVCGSFHRLGRSASASDSACLCPLLQRHQNASVIEQRCAGLSPGSANRNHKFTPDPWRASSPLCPGLGFRYTQGSLGDVFCFPPHLVLFLDFVHLETNATDYRPNVFLTEQSGSDS
jgi:hypothetical protein